MRKYIKSMRQQYDNNSFIFKQAKKMFHYEPHTSQNRPYCYSKPSKNPKSNANEFKDEYSSVKDNKLQNNEINESSWIAKLVNGIQQNSLQDLRLYSKQMEKKQTDGIEKSEKEVKKSISKQNVVVLDRKKSNPVAINTEVPTKKNSFNFSKKKSDTFTEKNLKTKHKNDSFCQNQQKEGSKTKSVAGTRSVSKNLSRNVSQSIISKSDANEKHYLGSKKKSLQNIYIYKGLSESKSKIYINEDNSKLSTLKSVQKLQRGQIAVKDYSKNEKGQQFKLNQSLSEVQEIKCSTQKKDKNTYQKEGKQKKIKLDQYYSDPLFQEPGDQTIRLQLLKSQKKKSVGSIRKNKASSVKKQEKGSSNCSFRQESTQAMMSPKFSSNNITLKDAIMAKPTEQSGLISGRQQKNIDDKYLRTDYSFKCNMVEIDNVVTKPAAFKKQTQKRYNYNYQIAENKSTQSKNRLIQTFNARDLKKEGYCQFFQKQQPVRQFHRDHLAGKKEPQINQQTCYRKLVYTKENYGSLPATTKAQIHFRNQQNISKEAYLQDSMQCVLSQITNEPNYPENTAIIKKNNPTKYSYIVHNSSQKQQISSRTHNIQNKWEEKAELKPGQGQQKLISRLNCKLNTYINQHQLIKQDVQLDQWNMGEPTYRNMQLTFNQLKKHRQFDKK